MQASQSSIGCSSAAHDHVDCAVLGRDARERGLDRFFVRHVQHEGNNFMSLLLDGGDALLDDTRGGIAENHARTLLGKGSAELHSHAAAAASDDHHLVLESLHCLLRRLPSWKST
jgi:hypothetical protein